MDQGHVEIQDGHAALVAEEVIKKLRMNWERCRPVMSRLGMTPAMQTFERFKWAAASRDSRVMHFPGTSAGKQ